MYIHVDVVQVLKALEKIEVARGELQAEIDMWGDVWGQTLWEKAEHKDRELRLDAERQLIRLCGRNDYDRLMALAWQRGENHVDARLIRALVGDVAVRHAKPLGYVLMLRMDEFFLALTSEPLPTPKPTRSFTQCERDILTVIDRAGTRLTTTQVQSALSAGNFVHGESTIKFALADLVRDGVLSNRSDTRPRGYGRP